MKRNPTPFALVKDADTGCFEEAHAIKNLDCAFYNECLDTAVDGKWKGFGCNECTAYQALDMEQKMQDMYGLLAARMAGDNVVQMGKANRTRGVKPGVDARVPGRGNCKKKTAG
jgi:hypothetical protein